MHTKMEVWTFKRYYQWTCKNSININPNNSNILNLFWCQHLISKAKIVDINNCILLCYYMSIFIIYILKINCYPFVHSHVQTFHTIKYSQSEYKLLSLKCHFWKSYVLHNTLLTSTNSSIIYILLNKNPSKEL